MCGSHRHFSERQLRGVGLHLPPTCNVDNCSLVVRTGTPLAELEDIMRYGIVALPRSWVAALAVALASLLALAGGARAETFKVAPTGIPSLTEAVSKANATPGANTI